MKRIAFLLIGCWLMIPLSYAMEPKEMVGVFELPLSDSHLSYTIMIGADSSFRCQVRGDIRNDYYTGRMICANDSLLCVRLDSLERPPFVLPLMAISQEYHYDKDNTPYWFIEIMNENELRFDNKILKRTDETP